MTSLWPDVSRDASQGTAVGSFARSVSKYMPMGMGDLFEANGVHTYAFHNYYGHYYRRSYSWPNLGYRDMKFLGAGMQFTSYWPASDLELMEQSIDDYINEDQFHVYYMTFSGHGPYTGSNYIHNKNIDHVTEVLGSRADTMTPEAIGYLSNNYELELAMNHLLGRLAAAGKLSNTVIVITGDHTPYYLPDEGKNSIVGSEIDTDFGIYHSTCIIYNSAMEPIETDTYCCNVDIAPTMLNVFNIPYDSRLMMGTDIFSDGVHRARLYNGSFLTDKLRYNSETGQVDWFIDTSSYSDEICNSYLNTMINYTEGEYAAATKMLDNNFMLYVWKNSGLMSEDEYWAELQREEFEEQRAETELLEEEEEAALEAAMAAEAAAAEEGNTEPPAQAPVQENVPAPEVPAVPEEQAVPQPEQ